MIQKIQLIKKNCDTLSLYISEFFSFIGCIVIDYFSQEIDRDLENYKSIFDVQIILNESDDVLEKFNIFTDDNFLYIVNLKKEDIEASFKSEIAYEILQELIKKIWSNNSCVNDIRLLANVYEEKDMFYYLYCTRIFLHTYLSKNFSELLLNKYIGCNNVLYNYELKTSTPSVYYEYAKIYIKYLINQRSKHLYERYLFDIPKMITILNSLNRIGFINSDYLAAKIYKDCYYSNIDAIDRYAKTIHKYKKNGFDGSDISLLYYELADLIKREKNWQIGKIERFYKEHSYKNRKSKEIFYKALLVKTDEGKLREVIHDANVMIDILINKKPKEITPDMQIYAYMYLKILGDCYFKIRIYDLAECAYMNAEKISKKSNFYVNIFETKVDYFKEIFQTCMPLEELYYKIISCAAKGNEQEKIKLYSRKMEDAIY